MDLILSEIEKLKNEIAEYQIIEPGNVFTAHEEARTQIKIKWLKMCLFEDSVNVVVNKIRILPNISITNISSPMHPEYIQILNTMMALLSPQIFTRDSCKFLEEYMDAYEQMKENPDIINALQSFKMNKIRLFLVSNLTSLQEHIINYKKDIENWTKRSKHSTISNMHS